MANKSAPALVLRDGDRQKLKSMLRTPTLAAGLAQRARVVLLASDGMANYEIADRVGVSRPTVNLWRSRYTEQGLPGLADQKRPGRPRTVDRSQVITATLIPPPAKLGVTHWSSRLLADQLGIEHSTVAKIWAEYGVKPWQAETFKSPPIHSWRTRSSTWSGCTWRRRRTRLSSVWMRKARSRR